MKIFFWISMLFLFDHKVYSQIDLGYIGYPQLIIKPGYTFQSHNAVNFECAIGEHYGSMHGLIYKGTGGGIRLIFDKNKIYSIYAFKECGVFF